MSKATWRHIAHLFWWVLLAAAVALSVVGNVKHAEMVAPASVRSFAQVLAGGAPVALFLMIEAVALGYLSGAAGWARTVGLSIMVPLSLIVFATSYAGLMGTIESARLFTVEGYGPTGPWLGRGLALLPDLAMVALTVYLLSHRIGVAEPSVETRPKPARGGFARRLAEAATTRAEAALAVPPAPSTEVTNPEVNTLTEPHGGAEPTPMEVEEDWEPAFAEGSIPSTEQSTELVAEHPVEEAKPSVSPSAEPSPEPRRPVRGASAKLPVEEIDPATEPFMEAATRMVAEGLIARKTAVEVARIIQAVAGGATDNAVKSSGLGSASTAAKIRAAWENRQGDPHPVTEEAGQPTERALAEVGA